MGEGAGFCSWKLRTRTKRAKIYAEVDMVLQEIPYDGAQILMGGSWCAIHKAIEEAGLSEVDYVNVHWVLVLQQTIQLKQLHPLVRWKKLP